MNQNNYVLTDILDNLDLPLNEVSLSVKENIHYNEQAQPIGYHHVVVQLEKPLTSDLPHSFEDDVRSQARIALNKYDNICNHDLTYNGDKPGIFVKDDQLSVDYHIAFLRDTEIEKPLTDLVTALYKVLPN